LYKRIYRALIVDRMTPCVYILMDILTAFHVIRIIMKEMQKKWKTRQNIDMGVKAVFLLQI